MFSKPEVGLDRRPISQLDVLLGEEEHLALNNLDKEKFDSEADIINHWHQGGGQRSALCLSGGGIRSATFSLGVIQGLAKAGLLKQFTYLSTVSGGGFIGSWLSRWIHEERDTGGVAKVESELAKEAPEAGPIRRLRAHSSYLSPKRGLSRDTATVIAIVLRNLMLTWLVILPALLAVLLIPITMISLTSNPVFQMSNEVSTVLLLLLLAFWFGVIHFLFGSKQITRKPRLLGLIPFFIAALLCSSWPAVWNTFIAFGVIESESVSTAHYSDIAIFTVFGIPAFLAFIFILNGFFQGVLSRCGWVSEALRERSSRNSSVLVRYSIFWILLSMTVIVLPPLILDALRYAPTWVSGLGGLLSVAALAAGYIGRSGNVQPSNVAGSWRGWVNRNVLPLICAAILFIFSGMLSLGVSSAILPVDFSKMGVATQGLSASNSIAQAERIFINFEGSRPAENEVENLSQGAMRWNRALLEIDKEYRTDLLSGKAGSLMATILVLIVISLLTSWLFGVNRFSLHAFYGNRLVRSYLASSRRARDPDQETGFDENDNISLSLLKENKPFHILNSALNLGAGERAEWMQRKAASFTFSALHSGSELTGYVKSSKYTGRKRGVSLGKAMTISGAAVSPAMGYHSSKIVGALLTLLNARLGWWLPNPKKKTKNLLRKSEPNLGLLHLLTEFIGSTNDKSNFVYLSDGGHFDNLGLYEMVRRRCRYIVVVDAGQDAKNEYESLSNAIRMIRVDFGININFEDADWPGRGKEMRERYAIGSIDYRSADQILNSDDKKEKGLNRGIISNGIIVYIKPTLLGDEPSDVFHYATKNSKGRAKFPHETTADQFFDEAQFESYRKLGLISVAGMPSEFSSFASLPSRSQPRPKLTTSSTNSTQNTEAEPLRIRSNNRTDSTIDRASKLSQIFGQASNWVAPMVASTVAAASVVTIDHNFIKPDGGIQLHAPEKAITLESPQLQLPEGCSINKGKLYCGELDIKVGQLGLSPEAKELKENGVAVNLLIPQDLAKAVDETRGLRLRSEDKVLLDRALGAGSEGIKLTMGASKELSNAMSRTDGVRINEADLEALQTAVRNIQPISTSLKEMAVNLGLVKQAVADVNGSTQKVDSTLQLIDDRISGLRNDSGGIE